VYKREETRVVFMYNNPVFLHNRIKTSKKIELFPLPMQTAVSVRCISYLCYTVGLVCV
jgi:hypothetical protein